MARVELIMPKMGESIMEATILNWVKNVGDSVEEDETILEIATDKVDSEIPSPVDGKIVEILFDVDSVVEVGKAIAIIETESAESEGSAAPPAAEKPKKAETQEPIAAAPVAHTPPPSVNIPTKPQAPIAQPSKETGSSRFYSPLVKNIAKTENISMSELESIPGSGDKGRVTKHDILAYVNERKNKVTPTGSNGQNGVHTPAPKPEPMPEKAASVKKSLSSSAPAVSDNVEIIEMDRMRKLIADHMVNSVKTSPHVTSFVEADVTNLVNWRNANKVAFQEKYGEKITYTPLIMDAVIKAIKDFPMVNVSVVDNKIHVKKDINIGMAAALPSGNLIVPVIKNADHLNLAGLAAKVNDYTKRARANKLKPDDIQGGTYTMSNVGTFGNVMGTPIINQPQVAILAVGAIRKKPAVMETEFGDVIAVRHMMFLSHSYDHRVVDGFLGGSFVKRVADYLEGFDTNLTI